MIDGNLVVLKNVFAVFDSVQRHLMERGFDFVWKEDGASDGEWTRKGEVFVEENYNFFD